MRPILTNSQTASYDEPSELDVNVPAAKKDWDPESAEPSTKRLRIRQTVGTTLDKLEQFLQQHWDGSKTWDDNKNKEQYQHNLSIVPAGYLQAGQDLTNQVGYYCAFCDTPVYSGLEVDQLLPKEWFPQLIFQFDNLLPTCAACRAKKKGRPDRSAGNAQTVVQQYSWPHLFWKGVTDGSPLPFRYDLFEVSNARSLFMFGKKVDEALYSTLLKDYQAGLIQTKEGWVVRYGADGNTQPLALRFTTSLFSPTSMTDGLVNQNDTSYTNDEDWVDHRVFSRTLTFFKALAFRDLLSTANQSGSEPLKLAVQGAIRTAIKATGFWGVWLTVFRDNNGIQQVLKEEILGTAARIWSI